MTNETGFSLEIDVQPGNSFKPLPDRFAFDLCKAYPVPGDKLLLHNTRTGKRAMVMPAVYASLLSCQQFQSLDRHIANIIERNPAMQDQQEDIRKVLQSMIDAGMMVSARKTCDALKVKRQQPAQAPVADAPVVTIITWERPEALERLLASIVSNCNTGKLHRLYVIDDSRTDENMTRNQALVEQFAADIETPLVYFGQRQQQSLLANLSARLPEHENAIHFLADQSRWREHWTSGMARNIALLLSCGHRLVMMDDDSLCDVYNPRQPKPDISFSDDPRAADFFASQQEWEPRHQPMNPDPIDRHMQCLGLSFSEALDVLGPQHLKPAGLTNATALLTSELKPESPVLMTECGSLGCPGTTANTWLPDMAPESLKRMLSSEQKTANALHNRQAWSGRNQPHFTPRPNMSAVTGFDNRQMLPPYLPITRGEDRLFGNMLDFVFPTAVTLDYPWAVPHLPIPQRQWHSEDLNFTPGDSFPMFFVEQVIEHKSACPASSPGARLRALSAWFDGLAAASAETLTGMYRDDRLRSDSEQLQHLHLLHESAGSTPDAWQDYLKNGTRQLNADMALASLEGLPVRGEPTGMEEEELIAFWQATWSDFAAALSAWPEIRRVALEVIEAGTAQE